jgi:hypothetical protein
MVGQLGKFPSCLAVLPCLVDCVGLGLDRLRLLQLASCFQLQIQPAQCDELGIGPQLAAQRCAFAGGLAVAVAGLEAWCECIPL